VIALTFIMRIPTLDRMLLRLFAGIVQRVADVDARDYGNHAAAVGRRRISELLVEPDDWLTDRTLAELDLSREGLLVLGIVRGDHYYGAADRAAAAAEPSDEPNRS